MLTVVFQDFISDDQEIVDVAANKRVNIRDIRKPPAKEDLHPFDGRKIKECCSTENRCSRNR